MSEQKNFYIDPAGANNMTGVAVITGQSVLTRQAKKVSFQNCWTGTPTGVFSYEGTNNRRGLNDPTNAEVIWTPLTVTVIHGTAAPAGAAGNNLVIMTNLPYCVRVKYTNSGGAGQLSTHLDMDRF